MTEALANRSGSSATSAVGPLSARDPDSPTVAVLDLGVSYLTPDSEVHALSAVSISIDRGEFLAVLGPSGCGKSTLLRVLAGLIKPSLGTASLFGKQIEGPSEKVGIGFQDAALLPWRNVLGNIELVGEIKSQWISSDERRSRAEALIRLVGLDGFENRFPHELSGGMQQRVALCRALMCNPSLLLLDEPFGALDALTREQMNIELQRIWMNRKPTALLITHSIPEAVFLADRVVVMTPRPGTIRHEITIPFARPRATDLFENPQFWAITQRLRQELSAG